MDWFSTRLIVISCIVVFLIGMGVWSLIRRARVAKTGRFALAHPEASFIYDGWPLVQDGQRIGQHIDKIDGQMPQRTDWGVCLLPGAHVLDITISVGFRGTKEHKVLSKGSIHAMVEPHARYLLAQTTDVAACSLIRLPGDDVVDERTLLTFVQERTQANGRVTEADVRQSFA